MTYILGDIRQAAIRALEAAKKARHPASSITPDDLIIQHMALAILEERKRSPGGYDYAQEISKSAREIWSEADGKSIHIDEVTVIERALMARDERAARIAENIADGST